MDDLFAEYGLAGARARVVKRSEHLTLEVETPNAPPGAKLVLRVSPPDTPRQRLTEELAWLGALRRDTSLITANPIANLSDALITEWRPSPAVAPRPCVLFEWIEGAPVAAAMSPAAAHRIGATIATLHRHSRGYTASRRAGYVGPHYDPDWLIGDGSWWSERARADLGQQRCAGLAGPIEAAARLIEARGEPGESYGLIHGDLHPTNIIARDDGFAVTDFQCLGLGDHLLDLAVTELDLLAADTDDGVELVRQLRSGYAAELNVPVASLEAAGLMRVAAGVVYLEWLYRRAQPAERAAKMRGVPELLRRMEQAAA